MFQEGSGGAPRLLLKQVVVRQVGGEIVCRQILPCPYLATGWADDCINQSQTWAKLTCSQHPRIGRTCSPQHPLCWLPRGWHSPLALQRSQPPALPCLENASSSSAAGRGALRGVCHRGPTAGVQPLMAPSYLGINRTSALVPGVVLHSLQKCRQDLERSLQHTPLVQSPASARKTTEPYFAISMSSEHLRSGQPSRALQVHPG